jgi:hypothetical protein
VEETVNVNSAVRWTAFVCVTVLASQFSVQAGEKDQFLVIISILIINSNSFRWVNPRSAATSSEHDHPQTGALSRS